MKIPSSFYTSLEHEVELREFAEVHCDLCGASDRDLIAEEGMFNIVRCDACALVYVSPQPVDSEMPRLYAGMYTDTSDEAVAARSAGHVERHIRRVVEARCPDGGRMLDVGCGFGEQLRAMDGSQFSLMGMELSADAARIARTAAPNAEIVEADIESAEIPSGSQDVVTLVAVLEHLKRPGGALARLSEWLRPGGTLIVLVPYIQHFIRLKRWIPWLPIHFEAPRHLFDFSPKTLTRYFEELGLEDIRVEIAPPYSAPNRFAELLIWGVKLPGFALHALTGGRYVYPFASAIVVHARKPREGISPR